MVYPGKDGPLDSIRYESWHDGSADFELLSLLAENDSDAAMRIAAKHFPDFRRYDIDITVFS